jgi:hypothetical protein
VLRQFRQGHKSDAKQATHSSLAHWTDAFAPPVTEHCGEFLDRFVFRGRTSQQGVEVSNRPHALTSRNLFDGRRF